MALQQFIWVLLLGICLPYASKAQRIDRVSFDKEDSTGGYYLAIAPQSNDIKGVVILLTSFWSPENLLTETKLHSVAFTNDLLTIVAPMKQKLYADDFAIKRINLLIEDIQKRFATHNSNFVIGGFNESGTIALRYTELTYQYPAEYTLQPKAVFGIDTPVDLFGLWHWSERQIQKNFWPGAVGDAQFYIGQMTKENGTIYTNADLYKKLTPFYKEADTTGNEQYLKNVPVRLYYDADIEWQLTNRRNSLYDTKMPDASELVNRLLLAGNNKAEFITSKVQGLKNNGERHPSTISIVAEVDFIQWIKRSLGIFDANTWKPPYSLLRPKGWGEELFSLPADFASAMTLKGVEDIRFAPGWGDSKLEDYWSYAYLWWLETNPQVDATILQENLQVYYSGLVNRNVISRKIPGNKIVPTMASIKKIKTATGDLQTFSGNIRMLDYMTQNPIILHTMIHVKDCISVNQVAVFIEISPKPYKHAIWEQLNKIGSSFSCN